MHVSSSVRSSAIDENFYPTGDGRPVGETPVHRRNLLSLVDILERFFAADEQVYVSGNMFIYYVPGDRLKHVSPDVFVVFGVPKDKPRKAYFVWEEEGHAPDLVIELTSASTKEEDLDDKKWLYRDILGVREYILFDPYGEYLSPALQGFRLENGEYVPIASVDGRLPSEVLGLHFEGRPEELRLYDPAAGRWLPTALELLAETQAERDRVAAENRRLHQELDDLRRRVERNGG